MTFRGKIQTALATAVIGVAPLAMASGAVAHPSSTHTTPSQAKAYGKYCAAESKKHSDAVAAGQKRTPFADCVTAMAHLAHQKSSTNNGKSDRTSAEAACRKAGEKTKHVKGQKNTPFGACVSAGTKLLAATHNS